MITWILNRLVDRATRFAARFASDDSDPKLIALKRKGVAALRQNTAAFHEFSQRLFLAEDIDGVPMPLVDVSDKHTISWLHRNWLRGHTLVPGRRPLVIDLGANDGLIGSMSLNFVQLGWDAVLVEPLPDMMALTRSNLGAYRRDGQTLVFVESAVGPIDGEMHFEAEVAGDLSQMEGRLVAAATPTSRPVPVISADSLLAHAEVSALLRQAGPVVLSVDIEGQDAVVTGRLLELGLRPDVIIVEVVHVGDDVSAVPFDSYGYRKAAHIGWNDIYLLDRNTGAP